MTLGCGGRGGERGVPGDRRRRWFVAELARRSVPLHGALSATHCPLALADCGARGDSDENRKRTLCARIFNVGQ